MTDLLKRIEAEAEQLSEGGRYPVVGYVWRDPDTAANGWGIMRTDAQRTSIFIRRADDPDERVEPRPWNKAKWNKYRKQMERLRARGYDVVEIYK